MAREQKSDGIVAFRNSQGDAAHGTMVRVTRSSITFEVYNPYSIVQLSEVLSDVTIRRGERTIYQGKAVATSILNTGVMLIVYATLVDPWTDFDRLLPGAGLGEEVERFVDDWAAANEQLNSEYQVAVSSTRNFLGEFNRWIAQGEAVAGILDDSTSEQLIQEFTAEVDGKVGGRLDEMFARFESVAKNISEDEAELHKAFARRELHPLMLVSPYIHRTFTKPLGYAGDYEMVNMMLRSPWEGQNTYAKCINSIVIRSDGAQGHRNRIDRLVQYLKAESARKSKLSEAPLRVLNVGCGPAEEVYRFIKTYPISDRVHFNLMDFNGETIAFARARLEALIDQIGRGTKVTMLHKAINDLLREAASRGRSLADDESKPPKYDLIYCAGLFDYLSDKICTRLMRLFDTWVTPGGLVVSTNVHPANPVRYFIEHILEWYLIYRDNDQMLGLSPRPSASAVNAESTGVNVFLEVRKPEAPE